MKHAAALVTISFLLVGCQSTDTFRVIDAQSGKPIAGASVTETHVTSVEFNKTQTDDFGPTDANGEASVVPRGNLMVIDAPGYTGKDVVISGDSYQVCKTIPDKSTTLPGGGTVVGREITEKIYSIHSHQPILIPLERMRQGPGAVASLQSDIEISGKLTFTDTNPVHIADGGGSLILDHDRHAVYTLFGIGVFTYNGTYSIDSDGRIKTVFDDPKMQLSPLIVLYDDFKFELLPSEMNAVAEVPHWPFRSYRSIP